MSTSLEEKFLFVSVAVRHVPAGAAATDLDELLHIGVPCAVQTGEVGIRPDERDNAFSRGLDDHISGEALQDGDVIGHVSVSLFGCFDGSNIELRELIVNPSF